MVRRTEHIAQFSAQGHEVVICTARNTVTSGHNVGEVYKNVGAITLENLRQLNIEYDEIYFGKPYGDIYINAKAFNTYDKSLFRNLGFYDFQSTTSKDELKTNKSGRFLIFTPPPTSPTYTAWSLTRFGRLFHLIKSCCCVTLP